MGALCSPPSTYLSFLPLLPSWPSTHYSSYTSKFTQNEWQSTRSQQFLIFCFSEETCFQSRQPITWARSRSRWTFSTYHSQSYDSFESCYSSGCFKDSSFINLFVSWTADDSAGGKSGLRLIWGSWWLDRRGHFAAEKRCRCLRSESSFGWNWSRKDWRRKHSWEEGVSGLHIEFDVSHNSNLPRNSYFSGNNLNLNCAFGFGQLSPCEPDTRHSIRTFGMRDEWQSESQVSQTFKIAMAWAELSWSWFSLYAERESSTLRSTSWWWPYSEPLPLSLEQLHTGSRQNQDQCSVESRTWNRSTHQFWRTVL